MATANDFINSVFNPQQALMQSVAHTVDNVTKNPAIQQVLNSPMSQLLQGKYDKIVPATKQLYADAKSGKYKPELAFNGEMEMTPGLGASLTGIESGASEYPFSKSPNGLQKFGTGQSQDVRQIRYKGNAKAPDLEKTAHDTLDRLGVKGDANEQLGSFPDIKNKIYSWIKDHSSLSKKPQDIPLDEVKQEIQAEVKRQFGTQAPDGTSIDHITNSHMNNVYDRARDEHAQALAKNENTPYFFESPTAQSSALPKTPEPIPSGQTQFRRMGGVKPGQEGPPGYLKELPTQNNQTDAKFALPTDGTTQMHTLPGQIANPVPDTISTQSIYNLKVANNNTPEVNSAFDKIMNGDSASLTPEEKTALASRNAYDNIIAKYHPDVKTATKDLSVLNDKNVYKSLESARFSPPPPKEPLNAILPPAVKYLVPPAALKGINAGLTSPTALKVAGGALLGGAGVAGGMYLAGDKGKSFFGQPPQSSANGVQPTNQANVVQDGSQDSHTQSIPQQIPQSLDDIKPDQTGRYNVIDPYASGLVLSPQDYQKQKSTLLAQQGTPAGQVYPQAGEIKAQLDDLETKYQTSQQLQKPYQVTSQINDIAEQAKQLMKEVPPNLLSLYPSFDKLRQAENGKYAVLANDLQSLEAIPGFTKGMLFRPQTAQSAMAILDNAQKINLNNYYSNLRTYVGQPQTQQASTQPQQGYNLPSPTSQGLPPIQQPDGSGTVYGKPLTSL